MRILRIGTGLVAVVLAALLGACTKAATPTSQPTSAVPTVSASPSASPTPDAKTSLSQVATATGTELGRTFTVVFLASGQSVDCRRSNTGFQIDDNTRDVMLCDPNRVVVTTLALNVLANPGATELSLWFSAAFALLNQTADYSTPMRSACGASYIVAKHMPGYDSTVGAKLVKELTSIGFGDPAPLNMGLGAAGVGKPISACKVLQG